MSQVNNDKSITVWDKIMELIKAGQKDQALLAIEDAIDDSETFLEDLAYHLEMSADFEERHLNDLKKMLGALEKLNEDEKRLIKEKKILDLKASLNNQ